MGCSLEMILQLIHKPISSNQLNALGHSLWGCALFWEGHWQTANQQCHAQLCRWQIAPVEVRNFLHHLINDEHSLLPETVNHLEEEASHKCDHSTDHTPLSKESVVQNRTENTLKKTKGEIDISWNFSTLCGCRWVTLLNPVVWSKMWQNQAKTKKHMKDGFVHTHNHRIPFPSNKFTKMIQEITHWT